MPILTYSNLTIEGIAACVPKSVVTTNESAKDLLSEKEISKVIKATGVEERRVADADTCASDLCFKAAEKLLQEMNIDRNTIDVLIFVSQTPDYRIPATSILLQKRLGLSKNVAAFDVNLGCSGYVYGLSMAYNYALQPNVRRVLLLVGDTATKFVSDKDRTTGLLFGDGGTATLVGKKEQHPISYFSLNSDGAGEDALKIESGGYRNPSSLDSLKEVADEDGNVKTAEQLYMNGAEVFNFTIREVPNDILTLLEYAEQDLTQVDYLVFHQANRFIFNYLAKKLKYPKEQIPVSIDKFGNTTSLSVGLTIVNNLREIINKGENCRLLLSGFGIGLSWATALVDLKGAYVSELAEI